MRAALVVPLVLAMIEGARATVISATASSHDGNVPANVLDGNLATRWSAQHENWIRLNMDAAHDVKAVYIAFFNGNSRAADFKIDVSTDGSSWKSALSRTQASGTTLSEELYTFPISWNCRYIRYTGYGNSLNAWNSITEFRVVKGSSATDGLLDAVISLRKTGGDGLYLTAEKYKNNELIARASEVNEWEQFLVEAHPAGGVGLKALSTGNYLTVQGTDATVEIRAVGTSMSTWEQFIVHTAGTNRIALQSGYTGKWLQASHKVASSLVYPSGPAANAWETFEWSYVQAPTVPSPPTYALPSGFTLVTSYSALMTAFATSNGRFRIQPGYYTATALLADKVTIMRTTGSNSIYDFTGATVDLPVKLLNTMSGAEHTHASWKMEGSGNTFIGGTFVNTYVDSALNTKIVDFKAYNEDTDNRPGGNNVYLRIWGDNAKFIRNTFVVRGSFPYGYGEIYGKGASTYFGKRKHSGIQVTGDNALLDGVQHYQKAFGHALFIQGASGTVIRNSKFHGEMRLGLDMYGDGAGSLPDQSGYVQKEPEWYLDTPIEKTKMYCLNEGGIRAYASGGKLDGSSASTGDVTVETTSVTHLRTGLALVFATQQASITGLHVRGCSSGFQLPRTGGVVAGSTIDAAFGEIFHIPYANVRNGYYDVTLVDAAYTTGNHFMANIAGYDNDFVIRTDGVSPSFTRPIKVGYSWDRWDLIDQTSQHAATDISVINYTPHQLELTQYSSSCTGSSEGTIVDNGSGNSVTSM